MKKLSGTHTLYKGTNPVLDISFRNGIPRDIRKVTDVSLLPPFLDEINGKADLASHIIHFLAYRRLSMSNPYFSLMGQVPLYDYSSLLDDYRVDTGVKEESYSFDRDIVVRYALKNECMDFSGKTSPNLSLCGENPAFFYEEEGKRFLLTEYSRETADELNASQTPYILKILYNVPFIGIGLQKGLEYFPVKGLTTDPAKMTDGFVTRDDAGHVKMAAYNIGRCLTKERSADEKLL